MWPCELLKLWILLWLKRYERQIFVKSHIYWNITKCIGHFAYVTHSQRKFLEHNMVFYSFEANLNRTHQVYREHTRCPNAGKLQTSDHSFQSQGLQGNSWTCDHYWELPNHVVMTVKQATRSTNAPKSTTVMQCCMTVIYLEVDVVLLTSWIALKRLQSKFVSSKARSQVLIPKILTDLCCNSSFSENGL